ncbi:MAG: hypothetical protein ABWZ52_03585 [Acidimicrobiales bacterium]
MQEIGRGSKVFDAAPVRRDIPEPLYQLLSMIQGENASIPDDGPYYDLYAEGASA